MLAPIIIFCFNRPDHLRRTVDALRNNSLASESSLFIFSDGPRNAKEQQKVEDVRRYLHTIEGFASISIHQSATNKGLAQSVIDGVTLVLSQFDRVIVLEDDMICATDFLAYSNEALRIYESRKDIFTISGYGPTIDIPTTYSKDVYLVARASSWGWSTWRDRWQVADWQVADFEEMKRNRLLQQKLMDGGEDLWPMLVKQQLGIINSWAVRWTWTQTKHQGWGLYPVHSKIQNIGTDGSGENFSTSTTDYHSDISEQTITFDPLITPDPAVGAAFARLYKLSLFRKVINWWKYKI